ncbi:MAG: polysaccharide biosynthesis/export family protein, partial [bacterium]
MYPVNINAKRYLIVPAVLVITSIWVFGVQPVMSSPGTSFPSPEESPPGQKTQKQTADTDRSKLLTPASDAPEQPDTQFITIRPGDVIEVVLAEQEWGGEFTVPPSGNIDFRFAGTVNVTGKTTNELAELLKDKLKPGYFTNPDLRINFKSFGKNKILVVGAVGSPKHVKLERGEGVMDALVRAGSLTKNSQRIKIYVFRKTGNDSDVYYVNYEKYVKGDLSQNITLRDGDLVYVRTNFWPHFDTLDQLLKTVGF